MKGGRLREADNVILFSGYTLDQADGPRLDSRRQGHGRAAYRRRMNVAAPANFEKMKAIAAWFSESNTISMRSDIAEILVMLK